MPVALSLTVAPQLVANPGLRVLAVVAKDPTATRSSRTSRGSGVFSSTCLTALSRRATARAGGAPGRAPSGVRVGRPSPRGSAADPLARRSAGRRADDWPLPYHA